MAHTYISPDFPATRVTGRYLAHSKKAGSVERAFLASDLVAGVKVLVRPTQRQAAMLAAVSAAYVSWACKRRAQRFEIMHGDLPLIPPAAANGHDSLPVVIANSANIDDLQLFELAKRVGSERMLAAAAAAETAAQ